MTEKTYTDRSNASRAAKKAGELSGVPHRVEKNGKGCWIVVPVIAEALGDEVPPKHLDADDISDAEMDAAAEEKAATLAVNDEQSPEAIARRQAERQRECARLASVGTLAPQETAGRPDLVLMGETPAEEEEVASAPDDGRIDDDQQTVMGAIGRPHDPLAPPMAETTAVIGVPDWYSSGRQFIICIEGDQFPQSAPHAWAMEFAKRTQRTVVVRDAMTFEALASYDKSAGRAAKTAAKAPRRSANGATKEPTDLLVKPVIASPTNQIVAKLVDRIEAKRGDIAGLREFRFKPSSTYYRKAHVYLQALISEAESRVDG